MNKLIIILILLAVSSCADTIQYNVTNSGIEDWFDSTKSWSGEFQGDYSNVGFVFYVVRDKPVTGSIFGLPITASARVPYIDPSYESTIAIDVEYMPLIAPGLFSSIDAGSPNLWYPSYFTGAPNTHYDLRVADYKQTNPIYTTEQYSNIPGTTFSAKASRLISICDVLNHLPIYTEPLSLNAWLKDNGGYFDTEVNALAVVSWAKKTKNVDIEYIPKISLSSSLQKSYGTFIGVKNYGHYVATTGFNKPTPNVTRFRIHDPNGDINHLFLEDYINYYTQEASAYRLPEADTLINHILYGASAIAIWSNCPIQLLDDTQHIVANSSPQITSQENGEGIPDGYVLLYPCANTGNYIFSVNGNEYNVILYRSDFSGDSTTTTYTSNNPTKVTRKSIVTTIPFTYSTTVEMNGIAPNLWSLPINSAITISNVVITARLSTTEVMVQSPTSRIPAVVLRTEIGNTGDVIQGAGIIQDKYINMSTTTVTGAGTVAPFATAIESLSSTKGVLTRILGRITSKSFDSFDVDGKLHVFGTTTGEIGSVVTIDGVYYNGNFYTQ